MPDLRNDITRLMNTLDKHNVYRFQEGRMVDEKDAPVPDILAKGLAALTHGTTGMSPLDEFNEQFERLRQRRKAVPVRDQSQALAASLAQALTASAAQNNAAPETNDSTSRAVDGESSVLAAEAMMDAGDDAGAEAVDDGDDAEAEVVAQDEELERGAWEESPTLPRLNEEDVELDMDELDLDPEAEDGYSDDEDMDEGEESAGMDAI